MTPILGQRHSGDQAFERLYRSHVQDVYRYALMVLRNRDDCLLYTSDAADEL